MFFTTFDAPEAGNEVAIFGLSATIGMMNMSFRALFIVTVVSGEYGSSKVTIELEISFGRNESM